MTQRLALGVLVLGAGAAWLLAEADVVQLTYRSATGALLIAIGIAVALTVDGGRILAALGVLVALAGLPALVVPSGVFQGGIGKAVERPAAGDDLGPFRHAVGKLTVDLTSPALDLDDAHVEVTLGAGDVLVLVSGDTDVSLDLHVGAGRAEAFGEEASGIDVDLEQITGTSGRQELELVVEVGFGSARIESR